MSNNPNGDTTSARHDLLVVVGFADWGGTFRVGNEAAVIQFLVRQVALALHDELYQAANTSFVHHVAAALLRQQPGVALPGLEEFFDGTPMSDAREQLTELSISLLAQAIVQRIVIPGLPVAFAQLLKNAQRLGKGRVEVKIPNVTFPIRADLVLPELMEIQTPDGRPLLLETGTRLPLLYDCDRQLTIAIGEPPAKK